MPRACPVVQTDRQTGLLTNVCYLPSHQQPRYRLRIPGRRRRSRHIASRVDPSIDSHVFEEDGINSDPEGMVDDFVEVRVCVRACVRVSSMWRVPVVQSHSSVGTHTGSHTGSLSRLWHLYGSQLTYPANQHQSASHVNFMCCHRN